MTFKVVANLAVGVDHGGYLLRKQPAAVPRGYQSLDVDLIRVEQEPHQRLRIVGLVLDIRQHDDARSFTRRILSDGGQQEATDHDRTPVRMRATGPRIPDGRNDVSAA